MTTPNPDPNIPAPTDWTDPNYRKVCGTILVHKGKVLVGERSDVKGAWQFPQGGLEEGETWLEGALRELFEETAIPQSDTKHLAECEEITYYHWIPKKRTDTQVGPMLRWQLLEYTGDVETIDVSQAEWKEFKSHKWVAPEVALKNAAYFRQPGYKIALEAFAELIRQTDV